MITLSVLLPNYCFTKQFFGAFRIFPSALIVFENDQISTMKNLGMGKRKTMVIPIGFI